MFTDSILITGIIILCGYLMGELAEKVKLPKVTGYIFAGILLNPQVFKVVPPQFVNSTGVIVDVLLSLITFSVGGTLVYRRIKNLGAVIGSIAFFEAELAFLLAGIGVFAAGHYFLDFEAHYLLVFALLMGALGSPTDPAATIAVMHEYRCKGQVSSTIMGVAALDDALGIINFSLAVSIGLVFLGGGSLSPVSLGRPLFIIGGSAVLGVACGHLYMVLARAIRGKKQDEAVLIAVLVGALLICFGAARVLQLDSLLATMVAGITVTNRSPTADELFSMVDRYLEELIFILFFGISGMHLDFSILYTSLPIVMVFVLSRFIGKLVGVRLAGAVFRAPDRITKYAIGGLIPQGGIVIGLALVSNTYSELAPLSGVLISSIIGATVIHELVGPILSKWALHGAGELYAGEQYGPRK